MLRSDTTALFERLREANTLLQEVLSGAHENMSSLENTLVTRVSDFVSTMNELTGAQRRRRRPGGEAHHVVPPGHHLGARRAVAARHPVRLAWAHAGPGGRDHRDEQPPDRRCGRRAARVARNPGAGARQQDPGPGAAAQAVLGPARRVARGGLRPGARNCPCGGRFQHRRSSGDRRIAADHRGAGARDRARPHRDEHAERQCDQPAVRDGALDLRRGAQAYRRDDAQGLRSDHRRHHRHVPRDHGTFHRDVPGHEADGRGDAARAGNDPRRAAPRHSRTAARDNRQRCADAPRHRRPDRGARRAQPHRRPSRPRGRRGRADAARPARGAGGCAGCGTLGGASAATAGPCSGTCADAEPRTPSAHGRRSAHGAARSAHGAAWPAHGAARTAHGADADGAAAHGVRPAHGAAAHGHHRRAPAGGLAVP